MPTITGQLTLRDFDLALIARGFDAFSPAERAQMINFGYRAVARKFPFTWEETTKDYTITPGTFVIPVQGGLPLSASSVKYVYVTSADRRQKLVVISRQNFERRLIDDLSLASNRSTTSQYHLYQGSIYLLPPPATSTVFTVHFYQYLLDLVEDTDVATLPQAFDEVILDAALVRCHRRAHELQLAADAELRVSEAIDDMLQSDAFQMEELQDRVRPDNTWL